jgi:glycosyltransferase involved in cell wall biosynthesis
MIFLDSSSLTGGFKKRLINILNNEKEVVWIINQFAGHPESGWGERHFYLAKPALEKYRIVIISSGNNHMFTQKINFKGIFEIQHYDGVEFCWVRIPSYNPQSISRFFAMFAFSINLFFLLFKTKQLGRPNFLLVSSMSIFPYPVARFLKWALKAKKLSFEVRDLWPLTPIHLMGYSKKNPMIWLIGFLERYAYKTADSIISLLEESKDYINAISKRPEAFYWVPNGVAELTITSSKGIIQEVRNRLPKDKIVVCYAGTIGFANALDSYIEVIKQSDKIQKDFFFLFIGDGYLKIKYQEQLTEKSNVLFIGKQKKGDIPGLLGLADICFISWHKSPLYDYGVSANKYFDYMASGKPILAAHYGISDPVTKSGCGIIVKNEYDHIEAGLIKFKSLAVSERISMGEIGKEYVCKHHTYTNLSLNFFKAMNSDKN